MTAEPAQQPDPVGDWLREHPDARLTAISIPDRYAAIEVTITEKGQPERTGAAWELAGAFADALASVPT